LGQKAAAPECRRSTLGAGLQGKFSGIEANFMKNSVQQLIWINALRQL
jgi:hypothetical protein